MSNLRIGTRLILAFLAIAILTGILGAFSYSRLQSTAQYYLSMYQVNSQSLESLGELSTTYQRVRTSILYMLVVATPEDVQKHYKTASQLQDSSQILLKTCLPKCKMIKTKPNLQRSKRISRITLQVWTAYSAIV